MVRLYLENNKSNKEAYIDVNVWSLVKAYIISNLIIGGIIIGVSFIFGVLAAIMFS